MEDSSKSRQHGMSLLLHRRKITADAAKSGDPRRTAKGAPTLVTNRSISLHFAFEHHRFSTPTNMISAHLNGNFHY